MNGTVRSLCVRRCAYMNVRDQLKLLMDGCGYVLCGLLRADDILCVRCADLCGVCADVMLCAYNSPDE